jgi:hypothetical protein
MKRTYNRASLIEKEDLASETECLQKLGRNFLARRRAKGRKNFQHNIQ